MDVLRFEQSAKDYTILIRTDSIDYSWQRFQLREHLENILLKKTKMEHIIDAKPQRGLHYAEIKQPTEGMYLIASVPDGRHQITASQKDFESGVARSFRSLWNVYDKINVNSIKYFAPVINHKISTIMK
jgi:hypothetical protein